MFKLNASAAKGKDEAGILNEGLQIKRSTQTLNRLKETGCEGTLGFDEMCSKLNGNSKMKKSEVAQTFIDMLFLSRGK